MLAVATGWTLEYIDSMPVEDFNSMLALNYISPFTHDAQAERDGLLITETLNSRRKKQLKSEDIFPYLSKGTPKWLTDRTVETAKELVRRHEQSCSLRGDEPDYAYIAPKIREEIEIESNKNVPDTFKITELQKLIGVIDGRTSCSS